MNDDDRGAAIARRYFCHRADGARHRQMPGAAPTRHDFGAKSLYWNWWMLRVRWM